MENQEAVEVTETIPEESTNSTGYCFKCKQSRAFKVAEQKEHKRGDKTKTARIVGQCSVCGTTMSRFVKKSE
jgi:hypothetical protein